MGVKQFSKAVAGKAIKISALKGETLAMDSSFLLYSAALGMKSVNALSTSSGESTVHINVILAKLCNMHKDGIDMVWVFDHFDSDGNCGNNVDKQLELAKRRKAKNAAKEKLKKLKDAKLKEEKTKEELLFSDTDTDDEPDEEESKTKPKESKKEKENLQSKINMQEKATFSLNSKMVEDCIFILNCLGIRYVVSPANTEADAVCARLTLVEDDDIKCNAVYSGDSDIIPFGGLRLIRPTRSAKKKVLMEYVLQDILTEKAITNDQLIKGCVVLGTDFAKKTPRVGPKTVWKKLDSIELTKEQEKAKKIFEAAPTLNLSELEFHNLYQKPGDPDSGRVDSFKSSEKINKLIQWLVDVKSFNKERVKKQILKANPKLELV